ncbi:hypothetical protein F511_35635 [Dorcoceras hygrometricum]|uniref:Uncharacterized protein n=1 Tax=Dorcoceras hygrometricum TaxID=472368 RepID=A0A2Z7D6P3_9LAMI|nr:hypothetical protein F511_35635 [Dorcoceras hygrometricum]
MATESPPPPALAVPFSTEVLVAELPQHFKLPNVGEYDGMGDPKEHLSRFENAALLHQYADPIKCRVFLTVRPRAHNRTDTYIYAIRYWDTQSPPGAPPAGLPPRPAV